MKKTVRCFLISIFLVLSLGVSASAQQSDMAPDFMLQDLTGQNVKLSRYLGQPVFLLFTTTWCPICTADLPKYKSMYNRYKDKGLVFLNIDIMESLQKITTFAGKKKIPFPILLDPDGKVAEAYGVVGVPAQVLIDAKGKIICWNCRTLDDKLKQLFP